MNTKDQIFFDLIVALRSLETISIIDGKSDQLTVTYTTSAVLEAQKVWMADQLIEWYEDLERKFGIKIVEKDFSYSQRYSLVLKLEIPVYVDWSVVSDNDFRKEIIKTIRKYLAQRIIKEHPLPFKVEAFWNISIAPRVTCKYVFSRHSGAPILSTKEAKIIRSDKFKQTVKKVIKENDGVFVGIRVESIRDEKYEIGYLEYQYNKVAFTGFLEINPLDEALGVIISKYFKKELFLQPHGEKDIT